MNDALRISCQGPCSCLLADARSAAEQQSAVTDQSSESQRYLPVWPALLASAAAAQSKSNQAIAGLPLLPAASSSHMNESNPHATRDGLE